MAVLNEEQRILRDTVRAWAAENAPVAALRRMRDESPDAGYDPAVFALMSHMGWTGILAGETLGDSADNWFNFGLVIEELGRTLTASPLLSSSLVSASALVLGGSEAQKEKWLSKIATGTMVATLAIDEGHHHDPGAVALAARKVNSGYRLSGHKTFVPEGMSAHLLIVAARADDRTGTTLFLVPGNCGGLVRSRRKVIDSRDYADLEFDNVAVEADAALGHLDRGDSLLEQTLDRACVGVSAEMLGLATQAFETTLAYMKTRVQFGQTIGSFQALQHRAAKMFIELQLARSCLEAALRAIDMKAAGISAAASLAKAVVGEATNAVSREMIQLHGGLGMTDAHDSGLYLKRARVLEALYGNNAYHRERYAALSGF